MTRRFPPGALATPLLFLLACVGDVELPPKPPSLFPVASPTTIPLQTLKGTRPPNTAVLRGDEVVVATSEETSWSFDQTLEAGENTLELWTQRPSGVKSRTSTQVTIVYEPACPATAVLVSVPPSPTNLRMHTLSGSKPKGTSVALDGAVVVPADDATTFSYNLNLPPAEGVYPFVLTTRDAKGRDSDPLRLSITYDATPPQLATRYPTSASDSVVANTSIPTNVSVFVAFSEAVRAISGTLSPNLVTVTAGGVPVAGVTTYLPAASAVVWTPGAPLAPSTVFAAQLDAVALADLAGNAAVAGATWTWSFTTAAGPSTTVPTAPTATSPPTSASAFAAVNGTRDVWSSIWINGELVVAPGPTAWTARAPLMMVGTNPLDVSAQSPAGVSSAATMLSVTRTVTKPAVPTVDAQVATMVTVPTLALTGTKPAGTAVFLNGRPVVCLDAQTTWAALANLDPGFNDLRLTTRDQNGVESDPLVFTVNFVQGYSGKVPSGWQLKIFMGLRDLRGTPVADQFVTGPNNYGIDVWLEGPVGLGETCEWDATLQQRKNVKYVATLEHYIGVKSGHTVPFADDDYRGADYIAALASGGMLGFLSITPDTPRRDAQGRELPTLMSRITEGDLHQRIDCFGLLGIDGCTEATVVAGPHAVDPWEPRRPPNAEVIEQGDYLLWVQLNLDRSGTWLTSNDTETCWAQPSDLTRGAHRIVRRVALGGSPWSVTLTPADEVSGPDPGGAGETRYLAPEGMTLSWGPP